jgi:hypothetical protein
VPLTFYYSICVVWREEVSAHHPVIILLRGMKWKSLFCSAMKGMIHSGGDHDFLHLTLYISSLLFLSWLICFLVAFSFQRYSIRCLCFMWRVHRWPGLRYFSIPCTFGQLCDFILVCNKLYRATVMCFLYLVLSWMIHVYLNHVTLLDRSLSMASWSYLRVTYPVFSMPSLVIRHFHRVTESV